MSCLIFLCCSCGNTSNYKNYVVSKSDSLKEVKRIERAFIKIDSARPLIKTGDLVVRTGSDFTSESLRSLNQRDKTYSHCGIASIENDTVFVYHALGGEWNPDQKIRRDVFDNFAEPYSNRGIGIYRYSLAPDDIKNLVESVHQLYRLGVMFDMKFDLQTSDRMYCAEFVYKSYLLGCNGKLQFTTSHIGKFEFIGVDDLFLQPLCKEQKKILYQ
ncbi:YiiX/YebB-like N1pC/P60 family cysteine hydrolase [Ferruginibacter sp. SUN106]|uniref:YiiX/YebB-like N1pC/P60 family cysteine hydrolase n=1 Tax=Ferruginibacter sp. SUN106 TaxID=2978348 RepID=UPI003D36D6D7